MVIIENLQRMTNSEMNAFLKTCEEPLLNRYILNLNNLKHYILLKIIYFAIYISITKEKNNNLISGTQNLLNNSFYPKPSEVFINSINNNDSCNISYEHEYEIKNVTLIFNETLNSTAIMFYGLDNIIEIDLSLLDFSYVTTMENMFRNCSNLKKINFGNINTSSVTNMKWLFYNCSKLISLDVSNFDTSKITNMEGMFYNNSNLISIDVSNFNTSKVESFRYMF